MKITDACVYPFPGGDTSVRRFALEAETLGFDSLVATGAPSCTFHGTGILRGVLIHDVPAKDIARLVKQEKENGLVISVQAAENSFNRAAIGAKGVHILRGIHDADRNAFDHITARMAADNTVALDIDLRPLIFLRGNARQRAIYRYRDLVTLWRRFEFPLTISSYAASYHDMRSVRDITALCSLIGMDTTDVKKALASVELVTGPGDNGVRVIE